MTMASGASSSEMNCDVENMPTTDAARVAAVELDDVARDRVEQHVQPERAPGNRPAARLGREQNDQDQQLGARFVQLRRMQRDAERRADVGRGERIGERDRPRHRRRLAVAAAGEKTSEPPDDVAERNARREDVARRPQRQPDAADVPERNDDGDDQAAVEHAARTQQVEELAPDCS